MATVDSVLSEFKASNQKSLEALKRDLSRIRAGKANPAILENIRVSYYGQISPLNQIGTVSTPDARTILIAPWDASILGEIEKAINQSDLGLNPQNDGKVVRINIPALTEERRKELSKIVNKTGEEGKVAIRQNRKVANEAIKGLEKEKEISEDDSKKQQEAIQKITDETVKSIDDILGKKTAEIMTI
ncbi:MAG: frr [Bacteriovoracaceae bacterium]|nr:frr [Bacteriovoracaceae bacterium]